MPKLSPALCDDPEGLHRGGREVQAGGGIWTLTADPHCSTAETNTTTESNYPPVKSKF